MSHYRCAYGYSANPSQPGGSCLKDRGKYNFFSPLPHLFYEKP